jgi:hypothetical protein
MFHELPGQATNHLGNPKDRCRAPPAARKLQLDFYELMPGAFFKTRVHPK